MNVKVTISKNSIAAKVVKQVMAEKNAFKKAVKSGKAEDYAKTKPAQFSAPV